MQTQEFPDHKNFVAASNLKPLEFITPETAIPNTSISYRFDTTAKKARTIFSIYCETDVAMVRMDAHLRAAVQIFNSDLYEVDYLPEVGCWYLSIAAEAMPQDQFAVELFLRKLNKSA